MNLKSTESIKNCSAAKRRLASRGAAYVGHNSILSGVYLYFSFGLFTYRLRGDAIGRCYRHIPCVMKMIFFLSLPAVKQLPW